MCAEMQTKTEELWQELQPLVDSEITKRLLEFHNALAERGQIAKVPKETKPSHEDTQSLQEVV